MLHYSDAWACLTRVGNDLSQRQLRLFACACCRWLDRLGRFAAVLDLAERFADGNAGAAELAAARFAGRFRPGNPAWAVCWAPDSDALALARRALAWVEGQPLQSFEVKTNPAMFLRDIIWPVGPIAPVWLAWEDGTVPRLAQGIYEEKAFERMPILADALEDAGCGDRGLLDHLRGPGPHVRGCGLLDALLRQK
jgi:hypothetical protein